MQRNPDPSYKNEHRRTSRPLYRPSEIILWVIVLVAALYLGWRGRSETPALSAHVYHEDQLVFSLDLADEPAGTHEIEDYPGFILETDGEGAIRIQQSPCPDKLCMRAGYLKHPGEQAICLPLELVLQLQGEDDDGFDAVIGVHEGIVESKGESGERVEPFVNHDHQYENHTHDSDNLDNPYTDLEDSQ